MTVDGVFQPLKLGEKVRDIRLRQKWTLDEASRRSGLAKSTLSKIENEQVSPSFDVVQKLAAGLGIDIVVDCTGKHKTIPGCSARWI